MSYEGLPQIIESKHKTRLSFLAYLLKVLEKYYCICTRCCMLHMCLAHQHGSSVYHTNTKLYTLSNLYSYWASTTGKIARFHFGSIGVKCLSQERNAILPSSETDREPTISLLPTCAFIHRAASSLLRMIVLSVFPRTQSALCQSGHRANHVSITIRRSYRLSYAVTTGKYYARMKPQSSTNKMAVELVEKLCRFSCV